MSAIVSYRVMFY